MVYTLFLSVWRKHGFSTPTHNLVSDCRVTGELGLSCQFLAGAGIAERSCYTPVNVSPLGIFRGSGSRGDGKGKMEADESGCVPSTELIILNGILKNGPSGSLTSVLGDKKA